MSYRVSRDQIRHDLFTRRYEVYTSVYKFLSKIVQNGDLDYETLPDFYEAMRKARFLFGRDVHDYLQKIKNRAFDASRAELKMDDVANDSAKKKEINERTSAAQHWLHDQVDQLHKYFGPYMYLDRK